jgi:hypothetical protein
MDLKDGSKSPVYALEYMEAGLNGVLFSTPWTDPFGA